ncbi:MAG: MoxR family ATPase [Clostridia bacterium]|jgi:MoxR-like ATPase|nr:MoxR family ATPase [Clostridia bacterium]
MVNEKDIEQFSKQCNEIFKQVGRDVIGQKPVVEGTIIAMIAGGNVLLEGVPGVGKTRLVRSLGRVFDLPFARIQFTPDLMPADVTGTNIIVKGDDGNSKFEFQPGPVFSNIILADEINRATPKTQSALLEAMQEHTVTVMGVSRKLNEPFFVLATQNPIEQDGTYPLPEAQMDRFMFKLIVPNPSLDELMEIVNMTQKTMAEVADAVCNGEQLLQMRATANQIPVAEDVMRYAMTLTSATHPDSECSTEAAKKYVRVGASPRAGQALISAAKVLALIKGRFNVAYSDINELAYPVLRHRLKMNFEAIAERITPDMVIKMILDELSKTFKPSK